MLGERPTSRTKLPVVKVRAGQTMACVIACDEVVCCQVHWLGTRSYMCPGVDCPACFAGVGAKFLGFVAIRFVCRPTGQLELGLLELTGPAYEKLDGLRMLEGASTLFQLPIEFARKSKRSSLSVNLWDGGAVLPKVIKLVPEWYVLDGVATLFGLPMCRPDMTGADWSSAAVPRAAQLIRGALPRAVSG